VATTEFIDAAKSQSESLGFPAAMVFVPHPIQDRTDAEIQSLAKDAVDSILEAVTARDESAA
jgi:hypothetical protein